MFGTVVALVALISKKVDTFLSAVPELVLVFVRTDTLGIAVGVDIASKFIQDIIRTFGVEITQTKEASWLKPSRSSETCGARSGAGCVGYCHGHPRKSTAIVNASTVCLYVPT